MTKHRRETLWGQIEATEGDDMESRSGEQGTGGHQEVLESSTLSALLPPCPDWPDLN